MKRLARSQKRVLPGTAGTLKRRERRGTAYWVREYIRVDGAKDDEHIGTVAAVDKARLAAVGEEIELAKALASASSRLRLLGFQRTERKPAAVLAAIHNHGLFAAGLVLVGSHAYGVLLNDCGIGAAAYRTQDVDVARAAPLELALAPQMSFHQLLNESGLDFVAVRGVPSHRPSGSFKLRGPEGLAVDILVPGDAAGRIVAVDDLGVHAQTIPALPFLAADAVDSVVLSPNQQVPVKVPAPQRFALHKLYSSQRRKSERGKAAKDIEQAAVLIAVLEAETPGLLAEAWRRFPQGGRSFVRRAALPALALLDEGHVEGRSFLQRLAGA